MLIRLLILATCFAPNLMASEPSTDKHFTQTLTSYTYQIPASIDAISIDGDAQHLTDAATKDTPSITVKGTKAQLANVQLSVQNDTLQIKDSNRYDKKTDPEDKVYLEIGIKKIARFTAKQATGYVKQLGAERAKFELHNATLLLGGQLRRAVPVTTITILSSGKSRVFGVPLLTVRNANIDASDQSEIKIDVIDTLNVKASGASLIATPLRPKHVEKQMSGQASIEIIEAKDLDSLTRLRLLSRQ